MPKVQKFFSEKSTLHKNHVEANALQNKPNAKKYRKDILTFLWWTPFGRNLGAYSQVIPPQPQKWHPERTSLFGKTVRAKILSLWEFAPKRGDPDNGPPDPAQLSSFAPCCGLSGRGCRQCGLLGHLPSTLEVENKSMGRSCGRQWWQQVGLQLSIFRKILLVKLSEKNLGQNPPTNPTHTSISLDTHLNFRTKIVLCAFKIEHKEGEHWMKLITCESGDLGEPWANWYCLSNIKC